MSPSQVAQSSFCWWLFPQGLGSQEHVGCGDQTTLFPWDVGGLEDELAVHDHRGPRGAGRRGSGQGRGTRGGGGSVSGERGP